MIKLVITDLDDTLYSWIGFFIPAFYDMAEEVARIINIPKDELLAEYRQVHKKVGSVEFPHATLLLPSVQSKYEGLSKEQQLQHLDSAFHKFNSKRKKLLALYPGVENALAFLVEAYDEEVVDAEMNDTRVVLRLHPALAPYKACVLPLSKKLSEQATAVYQQLQKDFMVDYDEAGSIGKRYRRQDEIGTPLCITYDFESVEDGSVTVRDRDTMEQERVKIEDLKAYIAKKIEF